MNKINEYRLREKFQDVRGLIGEMSLYSLNLKKRPPGMFWSEMGSGDTSMPKVNEEKLLSNFF